MITMLDQLPPSVEIEWLHGEKRDFTSEEQANVASGPRTVIPTAVFTIGDLHFWEEAVW